MKEVVRKRKQHEKYFAAENCYITEMYNTPEDPALSVAQARVEPGITTRWHRLRGISERYYIVSGQGVVEVGDLPPAEVKRGDFVFIPSLSRQRITNTGSEDLIFLAICSPRFTPEAYEDLEPL